MKLLKAAPSTRVGVQWYILSALLVAVLQYLAPQALPTKPRPVVSYIVETERYGDSQYAMRITMRNSGNAMAENVRMLLQDMPPLSLATAKGEGGVSLQDVRTCYEREMLVNTEYKGSNELCLTLAGTSTG